MNCHGRQGQAARVAMATFSVPADSPNIIESKSFKLYLNSFNQTRLVNSAALRGRLERDLSAAAGAPVGLDFILPQRFGELRMGELDGIYIDKLDIEIDTYEPARAAHAARRYRRGDAVLAAAEIELPGHRPARLGQRADPLSRRADRPRSVLRYVISFRQHAEFHEHCVGASTPTSWRPAGPSC